MVALGGMTKVWRCGERIPARGRVAFDPSPRSRGDVAGPAFGLEMGERIPARGRVAFDPSRARVGTLWVPRSGVEAGAD
jgi:hypothetical protein